MLNLPVCFFKTPSQGQEILFHKGSESKYLGLCKPRGKFEDII